MPSFESIRNGFVRAASCGTINPASGATSNIAHGAPRGPQPGNRPPTLLRRFIDMVRRPHAGAPGPASGSAPSQANEIQLAPIVASDIRLPDFSIHDMEDEAAAHVVAGRDEDPIAIQIRRNGEQARRMVPEPIIRPPVVLPTAVHANRSFIGDEAKVPPHLQDLLHARLGEAEALLGSGPIILGEDHTRPAARAILADLILRGKVTNLFLEMGSLEGDMFEHYRGREGSNVSDHLRLNAQQNISLKGDVLWTEELAPHLALLDLQHGNPIGMVELMELAVANGVLLHFADNAVTLKPASEEGMRLRNQETGRFFKERDGNQRGSVILIGGGHTEMRATGSSADVTVQACAGVPANRVMNLSGRDYR